LRAFEAAARHLSFVRAAEELGVTQTAISHQIRLLEEYSGETLFHRRPRPLRLTEAGARLFPTIRDGLDAFAAGVAALKADRKLERLRVTTTNAFASKWLAPRLPGWRRAHPRIALEIIGTDAVLDLAAGEADLAIRYMHAPPTNALSEELFRDQFIAVCSPAILRNGAPIARLMDLKSHTLIHCYWPTSDPHAPTWARWLEWHREPGADAPDLRDLDSLNFREELHSIDAALAGLGIIIISDALVAHELESGTLVKAMVASRQGYGFYLVPGPDESKQPLIGAFSAWARSVLDPDT
jgi:LysR family glycine cleavage system transcriptional activator